MRTIAIITILSACSPATPPPVSSHVSADQPKADFRRLKFLRGCWDYFSVDWGFNLCWTPDRGHWFGHSKSFGPMGVAWDIDFEIVDHNGRFAVRSVERRARWWDSYAGLEATTVEPTRIVFGNGQHELELVRVSPDTLAVRVRTPVPATGNDLPVHDMRVEMKRMPEED